MSAHAAAASPRWKVLAARRIFFGHQSVGRDIMRGVRALLADRPELPLRLVETDDPRDVEGPALMEARIGRNREPESKIAAFERIVGEGMGEGGIALFKYCYVDIGNDTNVDALHDDYRARMERLQARIPDLTLLHVTIPLRLAPTRVREFAARVLGRNTATALNRIRERYNDRLRSEYPATRIFDLAGIEATHADGSRSWSRYEGKRVPMLAPEWTDDGGHLNEAGSRRAAETLLDVLTRAAAADQGTGISPDRGASGASQLQ